MTVTVVAVESKTVAGCISELTVLGQFSQIQSGFSLFWTPRSFVQDLTISFKYCIPLFHFLLQKL